MASREKMDEKVKDSGLLDALTDMLTDIPRTKEEVIEDLKAQGIDPAPLVERVRSLVEEKSRERRLEWQIKAHKEMEEVRQASRLRSHVPQTRSEMLDMFNQIRNGPHAELARGYFSRLNCTIDDIPDDELASLLEDLLEVIGENGEM